MKKHLAPVPELARILIPGLVSLFIFNLTLRYVKSHGSSLLSEDADAGYMQGKSRNNSSMQCTKKKKPHAL